MSSILVIEDNNELLHYLCTVLRSAGYQVTGVARAAKGIEAMQEHKFDLLLLDINLTDSDAFTLLDTVRSTNPLFDSKVCFISSRRDAETVKRAVEFGASDYLVKPVLTGTLLAKVGNLLGKTKSLENFSRVECALKAIIADNNPVKPDLTVTEITEDGVTIRSSAQIDEATVVPMYIDEIQRLLSLDADHLTMRVVKCERNAWGKYSLQAAFVGLAEEKLTKLRAITIRGGFLNSDKPSVSA